MWNVVALADDLTGALETGASFAGAVPVCALAREALARGTLRGNIEAELGALRQAEPASRLV